MRVTNERRIVPLERFGIRYISMALFVDEETPVIWRGPMVTKLETEFLFNVEWGELDCLVLDLPPGTGDAQLTITQRVALDGGVIVTTPQEIALLDVKRGVAMFQEVGVPVLGVIENMSYHLCRKCGHRHEIFAHGGGRASPSRWGAVSGRTADGPRTARGRRHAAAAGAAHPDHPLTAAFQAIAAGDRPARSGAGADKSAETPMAFAVFDIETRIDKRLLNQVFFAGEGIGDQEAYERFRGRICAIAAATFSR